jgi:hypothetical protein
LSVSDTVSVRVCGALSDSNRRRDEFEEGCVSSKKQGKRSRFAEIYGDGQNRTGDTTIFSQGNRSHGLAWLQGLS